MTRTDTDQQAPRARFAHWLAPGDRDFDRFLREGKARFISQYVGFGILHTE